MLDPATAADILGLGAVDENELYAALDWLGDRQGAIEQALARDQGALRPRLTASTWCAPTCPNGFSAMNLHA
jgi:hypothetical protein